MTDIAFRTAWRKSDAGRVRDAKEFWLSIGVVMIPEEMERHASELCTLAYADGKIAAVSTVQPHDFQQLRSRFFYYRTVVEPEFPRQNLASRLCVYSRDQLAAWSREHPEEKLSGLFIILWAEEFRHRQFEPVITQLDLKLNLVGYTTGGYQLRVVWFKDASVE